MKSFQGCKIWGGYLLEFLPKKQQQVLSHISTVFSTDIIKKIWNDN